MQNKIHAIIQRVGFNKKLFFIVFPVVFFIFYPEGAHAASAWEWVSNPVGQAFKGLLYAIFVVVGWFTSVAITMFAYVVDPQNISGPKGMLNLQAVYDMWKFVRDFINIFFILGLLFIAFAFVFQIKEYSEPKVIIKLIIAALVVNFSFPLARIIIDLANVPMYFFLQMILGDGANASTALSSSLGASNLQAILLPKEDSSDVSSLLAAIIFLFIFNITILVLAFQLLIRLIALVILVILSPIGFVASGIPGLKKYGTQWWDNFLKYCFFGPAAIFMLVLATNFFAAISNGDNQNTVGSLASENSADPGFIASMVLFFVPIVMLWFVIGMAGKFSIAGASIATDYGKKFAKWAGKTATVKPAKWVGKKADSKMAERFGWSPLAVKKAWADRSAYQKGQDEKPVNLAAAQLQDKFNEKISVAQNKAKSIFKRGEKNKEWREAMKRQHFNTDHTDNAFAEFQKQAASSSKHMAEASDNYQQVESHLENALVSGDSTELAGLLAILAKNNDLNDLVLDKGDRFLGGRTGKLKDTDIVTTKDENGKKIAVTMKDVDGKDIPMKAIREFKNAKGQIAGVKKTIDVDGQNLDITYNYELDASGSAKKDASGNAMEFLEENSSSTKATVAFMLKETGMDENQTAQFMHNLGEKALAAGHFGNGNMATKDKKTGKYKLTSKAEQDEYNAGKFGNLGGQNQSTVLHAGAVAGKTRFSDGKEKYTSLNNAQLPGAMKHGTEAKRSRGDLKDAAAALEGGSNVDYNNAMRANPSFAAYQAEAAGQARGGSNEKKQKPTPEPPKPEEQLDLGVQGGSNKSTGQSKESSDQGELKF